MVNVKMNYCTAVVLATVSMSLFRLASTATCPISGYHVKCKSQGLTSMKDVTGPRSRVETLELGGNHIELKTSADFAGFTNFLSILFLDNNRISVLPTGVFNTLTNLVGLDLEQNQISTLPPGVFDKLYFLNALGLNHNQISTLPPGLFDNLHHLDSLQIAYNNIQGVSSSNWIGISKLRGLHLQGNKITTLPPGVFDNVLGLTILKFYDNTINTLPPGLLDKHIHLTDLEVYGGSFQNLDCERFCGGSVLKDPLGKSNYCFGRTFKDYCQLGHCHLSNGTKGAGRGLRSTYRAAILTCYQGNQLTTKYQYCPLNGQTFRNVTDDTHCNAPISSSTYGIRVNIRIIFTCVAMQFLVVLYLKMF